MGREQSVESLLAKFDREDKKQAAWLKKFLREWKPRTKEEREAKARIRRRYAEFNRAMRGDVETLIKLGKEVLGQKD